MRSAVVVLLLLAPLASAQDGARLLERFDEDGDGVLVPDELPRPAIFKRLDQDGDGKVTREELARLAGGGDTSALGTDVVVVRDVRFAATPGVEPKLQSLDLYAPSAPGPHPVVVFVHGGGWRTGDKRNAAVGEEKAAFFTREGFVYVSLNYRLSPKAAHPAHIEDVAAGVAWVGSHVAEHGGDPRRIAVMGHSAGAHLAALVACDPRWLAAHGLGLDALSAAVLLDGAGYDLAGSLEPLSGAREAHKRSLYVPAFGEDEATWRDASPIAHVTAGAPPFLIFHVATRADSKALSRALCDALAGVGVPAKVVAAEGKNHGTINRDVGKAGDAVTAEMMEFLRERLAPR